MSSPSVLVRVTESSQSYAARRAASDLAVGLGFSETEIGKVALVAAECASNLLKHAGGGSLVMRPLTSAEGGPGLDLLALDCGQGISDVPRAMADGYSTAGSRGLGLGGIQRQSQLFDIHSHTGQGTALLARLIPDRGPVRYATRSSGFAIGAVCLPVSSETLSGDAWACESDSSGLTVLVADGLGHGPAAATASSEAVALFRQNYSLPLPDILEILHQGLKGTRGAAVAIARIDPSRGILSFAGLGNIAGLLVHGDTVRSLVSHNGTVGHQFRKVQEFQYPWEPDSILIMHSDGLKSHWRLRQWPDLEFRHPSVIAGVLYRDCARGRDDVAVVVIKRED